VRVVVQEFLGKATMAVQEQATIMPVVAEAVQMLLGRTPAAPVAELAETEKHPQYLVAHMLAAGVEAAYQRGLLEVLVAAAMVHLVTIIRNPELQTRAAALVALQVSAAVGFSALLAALA